MHGIYTSLIYRKEQTGLLFSRQRGEIQL